VQRVTGSRAAHAVFASLVTAVSLVAATLGRHPATLVATLVATVAIARRVRMPQGTAHAWRAVLVGTGILTLDAGVSLLLALATGEPVADNPFTVAALPLGFAGLLAGCLLLVSPAEKRNPGALIDSALVAVTATSVMWAVLLRPHLVRVNADPLTLVAAVLTVMLFGGMTGALVRLWRAQARRHVANAYLLVAVAAGFTGNAFKVLTMQDPPVGPPWWVAIFWGVAYAGIAAPPTTSASPARAPSGWVPRCWWRPPSSACRP
jgi:hypothetical protein